MGVPGTEVTIKPSHLAPYITSAHASTQAHIVAVQRVILLPLHSNTKAVYALLRPTLIADNLAKELWIMSSADVSRHNIDNFQSDPTIKFSSYVCNRTQPEHRVPLVFDGIIPFVVCISFDEAIKEGYKILSLSTGKTYNEIEEMKSLYQSLLPRAKEKLWLQRLCEHLYDRKRYIRKNFPSP